MQLLLNTLDGMGNNGIVTNWKIVTKSKQAYSVPQNWLDKNLVAVTWLVLWYLYQIGSKIVISKLSVGQNIVYVFSLKMGFYHDKRIGIVVITTL